MSATLNVNVKNEVTMTLTSVQSELLKSSVQILLKTSFGLKKTSF
jgi:hypothetical protein